jgi:hypothetical protein
MARREERANREFGDVLRPTAGRSAAVAEGDADVVLLDGLLNEGRN